MFKKTILIAAVLALASPVMAREATVRKAYQHGKFFQNVKAEHVVPLLKNTAEISRAPFLRGKEGDLINITYYTDTHEYECTWHKLKHYYNGQFLYSGTTINSSLINADYPLSTSVHEREGAEMGYGLIDYDSTTGGITSYAFYKRKWWEMSDGHLQKALPAVTWEACPEFPSAATLGAKVNKKQTSIYYSELIKQDPGRRIKVPAYEAKDPLVVWYDVQGNVQKPEVKK